MINKTIPATELKRNTGAILDSIRYNNESVVITKSNKPYVIISSYDKDFISEKRDKAFKKYAKSIPGLKRAVSKVRKELISW